MPHSTRTTAMADTSSLPTMTRQWILASTPGEAIDIEKTFQQRKVSLFSDEIPDWDHAVSHVLVKTKWLSNDPAQRTWISPLEADRHYVKPTRPGELMPSLTVGEVIFSTHKDYQVGEFISGFWGWSEYALMDPDNVDPLVPLIKIPVGLDPADFLSLGMTALTAYSGLLFVGECDPSTDKTVVVSGAAGATGSIVVQIAKKVLGIERVIAIAGSEEKCKKVREIGADIALNYKSPNFHEEFDKATNGYVDVYYDNVGTHLDMLVKKMAKFGRVVSCGAIGFYDGDQDQKALSASAYTQMVFNQIQIRPFLVTKYYTRIPEMQIALQTWIQEGKLSPLRTIWDASFDEIPQGMIKLLKGENTGKLITAL